MELKERIEKAITHSEKKKSHIADEIGVSPSAITQWITGQTESIDGVNLLKFARATGTRYEWIALEEGEMVQEGMIITDPTLKKAVMSLEKMPPALRVQQTEAVHLLAEQLEKIRLNGTQ